MTSENEARPALEPDPDAPRHAPSPDTAASPGGPATAPSPASPENEPAPDSPETTSTPPAVSEPSADQEAAYSPYAASATAAPAPDADLPPHEGPVAPPMYPYWGPPKPGTNGYAVAALVVGIVGLCLCFGLLGIVFGHIARRQIEETGQAGAGLATAGIVLGWIAVAWIVLRAIIITGVGTTSYGY
jgi:hypothetical protein